MPELQTPPPARPGSPSFIQLAPHWPHAEASRFFKVGRITWHVQRLGKSGNSGRPRLLLIHGTGASTHSFMDMLTLASADHEVIAIDLPGHGFTQTPPALRPSQDNIATALVELLDDMAFDPGVIIGHSAGAAVMLALSRKLSARDRRLVSLNGALTPFPGIAQALFPVTAQLLTLGGVTAHILSQSAQNRSRVASLLEQTGGAPDDRFIDGYAALLRCRGHVSGTLRLMANWDLTQSEARIGQLENPILFVSGSQDTAVDPSDGDRLAARAPQGRSVRLDRVGHLAHEQDAQRVWETVEQFIETAPAE
ncbi:MAG: alpha/beta fold hydrolase BchO [Pseudomonadota bacterium]